MPTRPDGKRVPRHIAFIMDGNGRWAQQRGKSRASGHRQGAKVFSDIAAYCRDIGVEYMTVYAFSTENWRRPKDEVDSIMDLMEEYLDRSFREPEKNVRVRFIGDISPLRPAIRQKIERITRDSAREKGLTVNIALNYGGRAEIVNAARMIAQKAADGELHPAVVDEALFESFLYTAGQPSPDLLIHPGAVQRISNFLLWQCAYSELYFTDTLWPNFTPKHLDEAIDDFNSRHRRFGGI